MRYDVTTILVRPGTHPKALPILKDTLRTAPGGELLACWFSDLGALNQILIMRTAPDGATLSEARAAILKSGNPFGIAAYLAGMSMDTYESLPFMPAIRTGMHGPVFEVRTYTLKPDGLPPTIALWEKAVPPRSSVSPLLAAMYSVTGPVTRFLHIWPYPSLDERTRLRAKAVADGVWPPPGGPDHLHSQQSDIYYAADFSPIR